jgi:hypothetical protein
MVEIDRKFWHCGILSLQDFFCEVYLEKPGERSLYVNIAYSGGPEPNGRVYYDIPRCIR